MAHRRTTPRRPVQVRLASDELNLVEFPFALLSDRQRADSNTLIFSDEIRGPDGQPVTRLWTVTGADEFGLPTATDELVYLVLTEITRAASFQSPKVHFTRYDIVKRLGWPDKGSSYTRLHRALDRLLGVTITASRAFYDRATRSYVDVGFHILDDYALFDEPRGRKGPRGEPPRSYIRWNKTIFASFLAGYAKRLDLSLYLRLRSAVSRRLYRYLDKKRYDGKSQFRIGLEKLAFEKLGMSRTYFHSHIRAELARAHEELLRCGFLRGVDYETSSASGEPLVVYRFGRTPQPSEGQEEIARLMELGVAEPVAVELVTTDIVAVREQLTFLPYREARDPAALIVTAVRERWPAPPGARAAQAARAAPPADTHTNSRTPKASQERPAFDLDAALAQLSPHERAALEQQAADEVRQENPQVAKYPQSAAFRALVRRKLTTFLSARS
ncbi:MAG: replication initiator protein A, partial [Armatimonadetes bacterium]|nr:replication initiator protein A [Armatimonadota bacterium]